VEGAACAALLTGLDKTSVSVFKAPGRYSGLGEQEPKEDIFLVYDGTR
jgi:hypothetical protein